MKREKKIIQKGKKFYEIVTETIETEIPSPTQKLEDLISEKVELEMRIDEIQEKINLIEEAVYG